MGCRGEVEQGTFAMRRGEAMQGQSVMCRGKACFSAACSIHGGYSQCAGEKQCRGRRQCAGEKHAFRLLIAFTGDIRNMQGRSNAGEYGIVQGKGMFLCCL